LSGFNPQKIKTNPRVAAFYQTIGKITGEMVEEAKERDILSSSTGTSATGTIKPFDPNIFVVRL
jgi:hypothetical protein